MTSIRVQFASLSEQLLTKEGPGMADNTEADNDKPSGAHSGMDRRQAFKRGAMITGAVGAAWATPMVFDSVASPAAAATTS